MTHHFITHHFICTKVFNLDDIISEHSEDYNKKWSYIPHHLYRMLIIGGSDQEEQMHYLI